MTKHLNQQEAWENFWNYIRQPDSWADLERKERQYLYKTGAQLKAGEVGPRRLVVIFDRHRPGYYKLTENFEIDE